MKNTAIQAAIATITRTVSALEREASCEGSDNWHANYLKAEIRDLDAVVTARTQSLTGWQETAGNNARERDQARKDLSAVSYHLNTLQGKYDEAMSKANQFANERDSWAQRFKGLDADMRGTMTTLRGLEKEVESYKKTDAYLRAQHGLKTKAVERISDLFEKRGVEMDALDSKVLRLESENDELRDNLNRALALGAEDEADLRDRIEDQDKEITRLNDVLGVIQSACKG